MKISIDDDHAESSNIPMISYDFKTILLEGIPKDALGLGL